MSDALNVFIAGDFYGAGRQAEMDSNELLSGIDSLMEGADLRILNFESPLGEPSKPIVKSGPPLIAPRKSAKLLQGRFDVALLANNHVLDFGPEALLKTIAELRKRGIKTVGAGRDAKEAAKPLTLKLKGWRIGILSLCENEFSLAGKNSPGAAGIDCHRACSQIRKLKESCDATLVVTHGGNEHNPLPSPRVLSMSRLFAEAGATAVINAHPHTPQGIEKWRGVPIAYSLGNFVFDKLWKDMPPWWHVGMPVMLKLKRAKGATTAAIEPRPCAMSQRTGRLRALDKRESKDFAKWLKEVSAPLKSPEKIEAFFEAWATKHGKAYYGSMRHANADCASEEGRRDFAHFRNLWSCEAHNELIRVYVELLFQRRVDEAEKLLPKLEEWQKGLKLKDA